MNIEEERKAYEAWCEKHFGQAPLDPFSAWIGAKNHAAEMPKPAVHVLKGTGKTYPWLVRHADGIYKGYNIESFKTESDAIEWAKHGGYRVIE